MGEWKSCTLSSLGTIVGGATPSTKKPENYEGGTIPWITPKDLSGFSGRYISHGERNITEKGLNSCSAQMMPKHSVLFSSRAPIGYVAISDCEVCTNQGFKSIVPNENTDYLFLYYLLQYKKNDIENLGSGTTFKEVSANTMKGVEVRVPAQKSEQEKIARVLSSIDDKIEANARINENLERQARAIYQNMFENIDSLPAGWHKVPLGEVINISNKSFNPLKEPETLLEHYSIPAYDDAKFPVFELSTEIKSNKFIIDDSCFMISKLNPTTKRVWRPYCLTNNAVCSTEFIVYKAKEESMTDYLYSVINSDSFSEFMCSHVTGSTGSRQRTTPKDTLFFEVIIPTEEELSAFQSTVAPMYALMRNIAVENSKLKETRDALLPKLMSGEIDVSKI